MLSLISDIASHIDVVRLRTAVRHWGIQRDGRGVWHTGTREAPMPVYSSTAQGRRPGSIGRRLPSY